MIFHMYVLAFFAIFASIFDAVDGYVARKTGRVSRFGGFFDATSDRIADFLYITAFGYAGIAAWKIVVFVLFTTMLVSYTRARAEAAFLGKLKFNNGLLQRAGRIFLIGLSLLLFLVFPNISIFGFNSVAAAFLLVSFLNVITVIQRTIFTYKMASGN